MEQQRFNDYGSGQGPQQQQSGPEFLDGLNDTVVRHGFIRKVFSILAAQLIVTTILGGLTMNYGMALAKTNPALVMTVMCASIVISVGMMFVFICCPDTMRKSPRNYYLLMLFTVAESVMVGFVCTQYTTTSVIVCLAITALVTLGLILFACQTTYDFTGMGPYLMCAVLVLMGMSMMMWMGSMMGVGGDMRGFRLVYATCGALIFSMFIVYDTQLIVGGKHAKNQYSIDDYAMAAISLYIDIIQLFMMLLELFGDRN